MRINVAALLSLSFCFLLFQSCNLDEEIMGPGVSNGGRDAGEESSEEENTSSTAVLDLPDIPYNYANPDLPRFFTAQNIQDQDNTPDNNQVTDWGATLGRVLFYDKAMSLNQTIACASCHLQEAGFSDPDALSTGFEGGLTGRNSMGLTNARYYTRGSFFWDERAATLEDQVLMPIQDHIEMGLTLDTLVNRLAALDYYPDLFELAFGDEEVTSERISFALAQFIRAMVSTNSKFDEGLASLDRGQNMGNTPFDNFTDLENLGKMLFFSNRTNCSACHGSVNFVGNVPRNNGLELASVDLGIGAISGNQRDIGLFKVNSLRNIELTGPYMHDGRFATLEEVIEHYNSGVVAHPNLAPQLRGGGPGGGPGGPGGNNNQPRRLNLSDQEKQALVDFLKTLTDIEFIEDAKFADPFIQ